MLHAQGHLLELFYFQLFRFDMKVKNRAVGIDNQLRFCIIFFHNLFLWLMVCIIDVIFLVFLMGIQTDYFLDVDATDL